MTYGIQKGDKVMKSYYLGNGTGGTKMHMLHYFDGFRIREVFAHTHNGVVCWTDHNITGILAVGMNYRTAKRRLASLEEKATRRIG